MKPTPSLWRFACACLALFAAGCGRNPETAAGSDGRPTVALVVKTLNNPFFIDMQKGAEEAAKALNVNLLVQAAEREVDALSDLKHIGVRKILNAAVVARQKDLHARDGLDRHAGLVRQCEDRRRRTHRPLEPIGPRDVENEGVVVAERRERRLQRGGIVVSVRENPQRRGRLHGAHDLRGGRRRAEEAAERQPRRVREHSRPTA